MVRTRASKSLRPVAAVLLATFNVTAGLAVLFTSTPIAAATVPGESYQICDEQSQYLTSPWTYDALSSGDQTYTVSQFEALTGYGTTLPPLPSYIASQSPTTIAAIIIAPGSSEINQAAYNFPETPILYFFEGGSYGLLGLQSISGDEFIGGSTPSFPEPTFDSGGAAGGIDAGNDTFGFSGGTTTLAALANSGATTLTTTAPLSNYSNWLTFSDGLTYQIASFTGTSVTLDTPLTSAESGGTQLWDNAIQPIAEVGSGAAQGATTITLNASSIPLVTWGQVAIGTDTYKLSAVSGSQSGYTIGVAGLDSAVTANTPIYYADPAGGVTVEYLDISHDLHTTTGTITMGSGWTVEHNNIHDGYNLPSEGVAVYGGDEGTVEFNCFARMGDYGGGGSGTNEAFDYNELLQDANEPDPGCGCSGGGKWWGTLNSDIVDNSFVDDGTGDGQGAVWLDNGNTGTLVEGNYFYRIAGPAFGNETGFNMKVDDNLFLDDGWGNGTGEGSNNDGAVNINSSGGMNIPGSRYENQILVTNNSFINDWEGITIWQSDQRSCLSSGEGWPIDSAYCSGGFPTTDTTAAGGQYYFSHTGDSNHGGYTSVAQAASSGSTSIMVAGPEAIDDQIGFGITNPVSTTTADTSSVSTFAGSGTIHVTSTTGFPSSGQLRVGTSAAASDGGGFTGAVLSYTGTTPTSFTGVSFIRGGGTLVGPVIQVQGYQVTHESCFANDCNLTISPALSSDVSAGSEVTNAGTCALYATSAALPSGPLAPNSVSYWDGCQWEAKNISVSSNDFLFQPSVISASAPPEGNATTTACTLANNCGTNFMAFQSGGEAPFFDQTGGNAMMSDSSFAGCPNWDPGCTTDPLANINAMPNPPGVPANNGEPPANNDWTSNTYSGPWMWSDAYSFSGCNPLPTDSTTGNSMPNSDCGTIGFSAWQGAWQQDSGSTINPMTVSLNLTANQEIHGSTQAIPAYEDTLSPNTINSTLSLNGSTITSSSVPSSPYSFSLNTLTHPDGPYTVQVSSTDSGGNTSSDSQPIYIANGDLNGDGNVNISDLAVMGGHWAQTDSNYADGNIAGQTTINLSDLAVMAANWGWHE